MDGEQLLWDSEKAKDGFSAVACGMWSSFWLRRSLPSRLRCHSSADPVSRLRWSLLAHAPLRGSSLSRGGSGMHLTLLFQDGYMDVKYDKEQNSQTWHVILNPSFFFFFPFHWRKRTDAQVAVYTNVRMLPIVNWKLGRKDISTTSKTTHSSSEITFSGFRTSYLIIINDTIVQNTIRTCLRKRQRWHYLPWSLLIEIPPNRRIIWVEIYLEANNE